MHLKKLFRKRVLSLTTRSSTATHTTHNTQVVDIEGQDDTISPLRESSNTQQPNPPPMQTISQLSTENGKEEQPDKQQPPPPASTASRRLISRTISRTLSSALGHRPAYVQHEALLVPLVSQAWTPALPIADDCPLLTDLAVEIVMTHPFGLLMLFEHARPTPQHMAYILFFQECHVLRGTPSELRSHVFRKIVKRFLSPQATSLLVDCPQDLLVDIESKDCVYDTFQPILVHGITHLHNNLFPSFVQSNHHAAYQRFLAKENSPILLGDFDRLRCLGRGGFGKVYAVVKRETGQLYAMKILSKSRVIKQNMLDFLAREHHLLRQLHSAFIVNMLFSFQDAENLFLVMDMMIGGDLRYQLDAIGRMPEDFVRFYSAELVLGIQYLHSKGFVHRDIKPQNIMFDQDGHIRLTDLGLALECARGQVIRKRGGTTAYMSPETIVDAQCSHSCDWWALGIVLFEMSSGIRPFDGQTKEQIFSNVVSQTLTFPPQTRAGAELRDLISKLLEKSPQHRLGTQNGAADVMSHPFFAQTDWQKMKTRQEMPPFVPLERANVSGVFDFEDQIGGGERPETISENEQEKFVNLDFVNPRAFREEFFRVARTFRADLACV